MGGAYNVMNTPRRAPLRWTAGREPGLSTVDHAQRTTCHNAGRGYLWGPVKPGGRVLVRRRSGLLNAAETEIHTNDGKCNHAPTKRHRRQARPGAGTWERRPRRRVDLLGRSGPRRRGTGIRQHPDHPPGQRPEHGIGRPAAANSATSSRLTRARGPVKACRSRS